MAPRRLVAVAAVLTLGLTGALVLNVWTGLAVLALGLVLIARPLDPFTALLLAAGVAVFAEYGDPRIQRDLAVVLALTSYALLTLVAAHASRRWSLPLSRLTTAFLVFGATTVVAAVNGLARGNAVRFLSLEVFALLVLFLALAVGGLRLRARDLRIAEWTLVAVGVANAGIGFFLFATTGTRMQGLPFSPVPGLVALVVLALTLFDPAPRPRRLRSAATEVVAGSQAVTLAAHNTNTGMDDYRGTEPLFAVTDAAGDMYSSWTRLLAGLRVDPAAALAVIAGDYSTMTEVADTLLREADVPFRVAHHYASELTDYGRTQGKRPDQLTDAEITRVYQQANGTELPVAPGVIRDAMDPVKMVESRRGLGGPQPAEVRRMLAGAATGLEAQRAWLEAERRRLAGAAASLEKSFDAAAQ